MLVSDDGYHYLCEIPGNSDKKYIVVVKADEEHYLNGDQFDVAKYRLIKKKEETIKVNGKRYKKEDVEKRIEGVEPLEPIE